MGLVCQLAHVVEDTNFPHPDVRGNIQESWAVHQMMTTANFASQSNLAHFLCGGLNLQIEHHLFPRICHIHYKGLSGIVKETAQRSEERRVGKECVSTCRAGGSQYH